MWKSVKKLIPKMKSGNPENVTYAAEVNETEAGNLEQGFIYKQPSFTVLSPKVIYPNKIHNVTIFAENKDDVLLVSLRISCTGIDYFSVNNEIIGYKVETIGIDVKELPGDYCPVLNVKVKSTRFSNYFYNETQTLDRDTKSTVILIQLDKPIYKPGDKVKYRVVFLNRQLCPFAAKGVEIKIKDPEGNVIRLHKVENVPKGLFSEEMQLSNEPNFGDWEISAKFEGKKEKEIFKVDQYVLPKFKLEIKLPNFIVTGISEIKVEIEAKYTYGKGVKGEVLVTLLSPDDRTSSTLDWPFTAITKPIDGSTFVVLKIPSDIRTDLEKEFRVNVAIAEEVTGKQITETRTVKVCKFPYKIELIDLPKRYKPNLHTNLKLKISTQDNLPVADSKEDPLTIEHRFTENRKITVFKTSIPETGIVPFSVIINSNNDIPIVVKYKDLKETFSIKEKFSSMTEKYIQASIGEGNSIRVKSNTPMKAINYLAVIGNEIVRSGREYFTSERKETTLVVDLEKTDDREINATIIVFAMFGDENYTYDELPADSVSYSLTKPLSNYLNIKMSKYKLEPGENINLALETRSNSIIALRGIDQSVLLLREERNIDSLRIDEIIKQFYPGTTSDKNGEIFDDAGILIYRDEVFCGVRMSKLIERAGCMLRGSGNYARGPYSSLKSMSSPTKEIVPKLLPPVRIRENFPESWIWETIEAYNTKVNISKTVPDTLTSWVLTGFSLNPEFGIGVSLIPQVIETFRPFFISLNLPFSVVRGEIFTLQVLLHSYLNEETAGVLIMKNVKKEFKFIENSYGNSIVKKEVKISPLQVSSVTITIIPLVVGEIKLELEARTTLAGDAISQTLNVKPPGHKQSKSTSVLLDVKQESPVTLSLTAIFPEKRVINGDSIKFSVVGNLLGPTITNLDKLIQLPCGCGEQNMLNFVPDIVILDYLTASGTLTPEIEKKAINFLEIGYQRQLTYLRYDGSFSAWGKSDSSGSTWLTAFVARSFISASRYITIGENVITDALKYLIMCQDIKGEFSEKGRVLYLDTQGSGQGIALTAYALLTFLEYSEAMPKGETKYKIIMENSLKYLSSSFADIEDTYTLVIVCYAFHVANFEEKDKVFKKVETRSCKEKDGMYWHQSYTNDHFTENPFTSSMEIEHRPLSVEMTAYCLMIYLMRNKLAESIPIAKWLLTQRNENGGFKSTQDTIVGLTALAKFPMRPNPQLIVKLKHSLGKHKFNVNKYNDIVLQEYILPSDTTEVTVTASGEGTAMAQLSWSYYVEEGVNQSPFIITPEIKEFIKTQGKFELNISSAFIDEAAEESKMVVMEVNLPSGFIFERDCFSDLRNVENLMRFEEENDHTKLNIYFSYLTRTEILVELEAIRSFDVSKLAPSAIIVYDYYDTTRKTRVFINAPV